MVRARHQGIEQQRGVGGGAGERSGNHELRGIARAFPGRHEPTSGLQPDQPACRGRDPHGAAAVGPWGERQQPRGHRGSAAARGAARTAAECMRIARRRGDPVLAVGRQAELRDLRLAQRDDPGGLERGGKRAVGQGRLALQGGASMRGDDPCHIRQVLEGDRHSMQRGQSAAVPAPEGVELVRCRGVLPRLFRGDRDEGPEVRVLGFDAVQEMIGGLPGGQLPGTERIAELDGGEFVDFSQGGGTPAVPGAARAGYPRGTCPFLGPAEGHNGIMPSARGQGQGMSRGGGRGRAAPRGVRQP